MDSERKKNKIDIEKFNLCKNDEERVKLALSDLGVFLNITDECPYGRKSPEASENFRQIGNFLLNTLSPNLEGILKLYSKSILYAPPRSNELSLAYANRSAVLFRAKYYKECLEDISRALEAGYPDSLKPKLLIRRVTCNYALTGNVDFEGDKGLIEARALIEKLPATDKIRKMVEGTLNDRRKITSVGRQVKKTRPKYRPEMKGRNSHLPGASDAIALRYTEKFGRHLVATRDINSGEVLLIEKPYARIVMDKWIYCICSHCARRTWNGIPCDNCVHVMFCSAECKQTAWEEYHDVECEINGFSVEIGIWSRVLMGLRITVKAIKEAGSIEALRERLRELDSVKASDVDIPINPNSYETFYLMSDNPEYQEPDLAMSCSSLAGCFTYFFAVRTNLFGERVTGSIQIVKDSEQLLFMAGLTLRNIRIAHNRAHECSVEGMISPEDHQILTLLPVSSFLNNKCYDAAKLLPSNENMILVTHVPIIKGEQVFIHYGGDYQNVPRDLRRKYLKNRWQFDCNCLACKDNWTASTATEWIDQNLSPRILGELHNEMNKVRCPSPEETREPMKMIPYKENFCQMMDSIYPRVNKPCSNVESLKQLIVLMDMELSSMAYPRFVDKCTCPF